MALKINQQNQALNVQGHLTGENAMVLKKHFEVFSKDLNDIILNLDYVSTIEESGAYTLEQIYLDFMRNNKIIQIIGRENKGIAQTMKATKTSYILSDDHL